MRDWSPQQIVSHPPDREGARGSFASPSQKVMAYPAETATGSVQPAPQVEKGGRGQSSAGHLRAVLQKEHNLRAMSGKRSQCLTFPYLVVLLEQ